MLPAVDATVRHYQHAESHTEGLAPALRKALRRRERRQAMGRQHGGAPAAPTGDVEEGSVFQGIAGHRDRRKLHIQQVDAEAEAFAAETFADREGATLLFQPLRILSFFPSFFLSFTSCLTGFRKVSRLYCRHVATVLIVRLQLLSQVDHQHWPAHPKICKRLRQ
jgi:hypothetical protein